MKTELYIESTGKSTQMGNKCSISTRQPCSLLTRDADGVSKSKEDSICPVRLSLLF